MTETDEIYVGMIVIAGSSYGPLGGLGYITKIGKYGGAPGAWIQSHSGDPGATVGYPSFCPDWCIKPAVVGETVCHKPRHECFCGLFHARAQDLASLPRAQADHEELTDDQH